MGHGVGPADGDFIVLSDQFVEFDLNVGEGVVETAVGGCEVGWTVEGGSKILQEPSRP